LQVDADATRVPVTYGFTDGNRRVSLTPTAPLAFSTKHRVFLNAGIESPTGDPLANPQNSDLETGAPPPLALHSIFPPSAIVGVNVTISGTGFGANPAANTVSFNGVNAIPISGNASQLLVRVPPLATTGPVTVTRGATSNALEFHVLVPNQSPIDEVVSTVGLGTGGKSCAVSPDGTLLYTVSPDGDVVIPIDIEGETTFPSISVGDQPVAIVIHPEGGFAYVANFNSSSVSIIDIDAGSGTFNTVVETVTVGANPADIAVFPDGDRVVVANAGSGNLSLIDGDASSVSYHTVVSTIGQGTGANSHDPRSHSDRRHRPGQRHREPGRLDGRTGNRRQESRGLGRRHAALRDPGEFRPRAGNRDQRDSRRFGRRWRGSQLHRRDIADR
jgi:YVTN family beta-propeller protein